MKLFIGGFAQGKLEYVLNKYNLSEQQATEELSGVLFFQPDQKVIFHHFENWFKKQLEREENPEEQMDELTGLYRELIVISAEVGNGIVPIEASEREYRERLGRYLCRLAAQAECVERIICGIGQRIK